MRKKCTVHSAVDPGARALHRAPGVSTPNHTTRPERRGFFILLAIAIVAIFVFNLQAIGDLMRRQIDIVAMVTHAPGVRVGTEVTAEGVKVGRVRNVSITKRLDTAYVALDLRLDHGATAIITTGSDVLATRQRFIGDPVIRLFAGAPGDDPIREGDTIVGHPRLTPEQLLERAEVLPAMLDSLLETARLVQAGYEARQPYIERMSDQLATVADAATALAGEMERGSLGRMLDARTGLPAHVRALRLRVGDLGEAARRAAERYSPDAEDGLAAQLERLSRRSADVDAALAGLQARVEDGDGFFARAQADTAIQVAIRGIQIQLDSLRAEAFSIALQMFLP